MAKQHILYAFAFALAIIMSACTTKKENNNEAEVAATDARHVVVVVTTHKAPEMETLLTAGAIVWCQ
jgi:hypothetical protein